MIDRFVIAELAAGRMNLPVGDRFLNALVNILERAADTIVTAIQRSLRQPRLGQAKARDRPSFEACSYEEVVTGSDDMTLEQKDYWLDKPSSWTPGVKFD